MDVKIDASWKRVLQDEFEKPYFAQLTSFVRDEYKTKKIFPPGNMIFSAFDHCPFDKVKVVIIGQDPYHNDGQAHGLCFSVNTGVDFPPSLINIFKEIERDLGKPMPTSGNLERWADQGVLMLNTTMTVERANANAHKDKGWQFFTDRIIEVVSQQQPHLVFMLWGAHAQSKQKLIDATKHLVLTSVHPSPLSAYRGFLGCGHFSRTNKFLEQNGETPIEWRLPPV